MDHDYPIYTVQNECQDCYKCVRHCPCKAIRVKGGNASVIPELCVACGICYQVCPAGAKQIRDDISRAKFLIADGHKVYASIAPSWVNYFPGLKPEILIHALRKLGFAWVGETALGAQQVSAATADMIAKADHGIFISSACPSVVEFIKRYIPEHTPNITPIMSPLLTHCQMMKKHYGQDIKTVFFGPCIAKKQEADTHPGLLNVALTFEDLKKWLEEARIKFQFLTTEENDRFSPAPAEEGRLYPIEGGMIDTVKSGQNDKTVYIKLSSLKNIERALKGQLDDGGRKIFIECLACRNGCVNGPVMDKCGTKLDDLVRIAAIWPEDSRSSASRKLEVANNEEFTPIMLKNGVPDEKSIQKTLQSIGKFTKDDELNCGGCGYQTCRDFAKALISGKGEPEMCVSHLKKLSQKKANALIKYIPAGVVIVDNNLSIIECNLRFAKMFDESSALAFEVQPGLRGVSLGTTVEFTDLFRTAMATGNDLERRNFVYKGMILDIDIFSIERNRVVGAIIQDVTQSELQREKIAEKARSVIMKNIMTVQKIANCLGEHMADTEIILKEVASGYDSAALIESMKKEKDSNGQS